MFKLPTYEVIVNGKSRRVELTKKAEETFKVRLDDEKMEIEISARKSEDEKTLTLRMGDKAYSAELGKTDAGKNAEVTIDGVTFKVDVRLPSTNAMSTGSTMAFTPEPLVPAKRAAAKTQAVEGAVAAPMTGKIVSVKVKKGDQVKQNQVLCVVEAMKMENEITASKQGTVKEARASEGSSVSEGEVLFVIG